MEDIKLHAWQEENVGFIEKHKFTLIADEMGLGKTIEALAGATLRSIIMQKNKHHRDLPNLIVSPQDGIQNQWYDTLIKSGVDPAQITIIGEKKKIAKGTNKWPW